MLLSKGLNQFFAIGMLYVMLEHLFSLLTMQIKLAMDQDTVGSDTNRVIGDIFFDMIAMFFESKSSCSASDFRSPIRKSRR